MSTNNDERPNPAQHKEIARGSGAAAILMFLHIAVTGYLASIVYFLLAENTSAFWNLLPFSAAVFYYFPATFAVICFLPTNPLTKVVGNVARWVGCLSLVVFGACLTIQKLGEYGRVDIPWVHTAAAVAAGVAGGLLMRLLFGAVIGVGGGNFEKNDRVDMTS